MIRGETKEEENTQLTDKQYEQALKCVGGISDQLVLTYSKIHNQIHQDKKELDRLEDSEAQNI